MEYISSKPTLDRDNSYYIYKNKFSFRKYWGMIIIIFMVHIMMLILIVNMRDEQASIILRTNGIKSQIKMLIYHK